MHKWAYCYLLSVFISCTAIAVEFSDDNLALLDVVFERQVIGSGLDVYVHKGTYYIPLVDLVALLEMDISTQEQGAVGRMTAAGPSFSLSYTNNDWLVTINGNETVPSVGGVVIFDDLIYISPKLAEQWFGISLQPNFSESQLYLTSKLNLPFKSRISRLNRKVSTLEGESVAVQPLLKQDYDFLEPPSVDVRLNHNARRNYKNDNLKGNDSTYYSVITTGDMLGMSTQTLWTGLREDGLKNMSIKMDRYDHTQSMLGFMGLSQISLGDTSHPTFSGAPGSYGRGVVISNSPTHSNSNRDIRDIEGDYYPDWDVELYLGGALIGFQKTDENGHYLFKDVIVFEGDNAFTLKFYGPNGRVDTKEEHIAVGASTDTKHKMSYSLSFSQPGRKVYEVDPDRIAELEDAPETEQAAVSTGLQLGPFMSLSMGAIERQVGDITNHYYNVGVRANVLRTHFSLSATTQNNEDPSVHFSMGGNILDTRYTLAVSENEASSSHSLALNRRVGQSGSFIFQSYQSSTALTSIQGHRLGLSGRVSRVRWDTALDYKAQDNDLAPETDYETLSGALFFSTAFQTTSLRMNIGYDVLPEAEIHTVGLSATGRLDTNTKLHFTVNRSLLANDTRYRLAMNWKLDSMLITPSISYSDNGWIQGNIGISASLGRRNGRVGNYYQMSAKPALSKGNIKARLFEDENQDGEYQLGERLLGGGEVRAEQSHRKSRSNKGGIAWLESLTPWVPTDITIREDSIDADSVKQSIEPFSLVPRPGKVIEIDIPFTRVGDTDGTVYRDEAGGLEPARGVTVLLMDKEAKILQKQITDSEGYFDFVKIAPGEYTLSVKEETILSTTHSVISISPKGNYVAGVELVIEKAPERLDPLDSLLVPESTGQVPLSGSKSDVPVINGVGNDAFSGPVAESFQVTIEPTLVALPFVAQAIGVQPLKEQDTIAEVGLDGGDSTIKEKQGKMLVSDSSANLDTELPSNTPSDGPWSLQAASYSSLSTAQTFVRRVEGKGESAFIKEASINNKTYYRVYIGRYSNKELAISAKAPVDRTFNIQSIVSKPK